MMKLPEGTIFISVVLSICILVLGAGAGATGMQPSDTSAFGWQFGAQQGGAAGSDSHPPGFPGPGNMTSADNRTPMNFDNATMPINGTFPVRDTMTRGDNRTPVGFGNGTRSFDGSYRMHANRTFEDNRTPTDFGNATRPFNGTVPGDRDTPGHEPAGGNNGLNTSQKSQIDELIEALTRFFGGFS